MKIFLANPISRDFEFEGHTISHVSYYDFLKENDFFLNLMKYGVSHRTLFAKLRNPEYLQALFINKDKSYFNFLENFKERFKNYDVIVMNPGLDLVHPEFLDKHFKKCLKVLHFIDDPHTSYSYSFPFSWVFDAATYISPGYSKDYTMKQILEKVGFKNTYWIPHCVNNIHKPKFDLNSFANQYQKRINKAFYVGSFYSKKVNRLIKIKKYFNKNFDIYGNYPLKGLSYFLSSIYFKNLSFYRPKKLDLNQWRFVNENYQIGVNMHLSSPSLETGNSRLYELAYNGVAQVCDIAENTQLENIFEPDKEILTYQSIDECISKVERLMFDNELKTKIAYNGYKRAISDYNYYKVLTSQISWFKSLR